MAAIDHVLFRAYPGPWREHLPQSAPRWQQSTGGYRVPNSHLGDGDGSNNGVWLLFHLADGGWRAPASNDSPTN